MDDDMEIGIWAVLVVIAINDAREYRIPNKLVGVLLVLIVLHLLSTYGGVLEISAEHWYGGLVSFAVCFGLYLLRLMGAGDVKLLGALGILVGLQSLTQFLSVVVLAGAVQSVFYLAHQLANSQLSVKQHFADYVTHNIYGRLGHGRVKPIQMRVPFAPAIVAALALYPVIG